MRSTDYDVVVIGGAFSGSALATLLKRWLPSSRILVAESSTAFDHKVGEATVEISAMMLGRVLGLHDFLARTQLPKHGLRYWFADRPDRTLAEMTEVGPREVPRLPAYQLDRATTDERLLELAAEVGSEVLRPAKVTSFELGWPVSRVAIEAGGELREVTARWVVDASGRHAVIARKKGILKLNQEHPTAAAWGRWSAVADLDGTEIMGIDPRHPNLPPIGAARRLATNHFCGHGWWCWVIPLRNGETSIGVVYDKRHFTWPSSGGLMEQYRTFIATQPGLRELVARATLDEADFRSYAHLAYSASQYMDRGWALVGDAAAFLDPYYSPGLDHASLSTYATAKLIEEDLLGKLDEACLGREIADHNERFQRSYRRWFTGLYQDKYEVFGDAELCAASFLLDTAMYYTGVITPIHEDLDFLRHPLFGQPIWQTAAAYRIMRFYNQRLIRLARLRRELGIYGRRNAGWRFFVRTASLGRTGSVDMFKVGLKTWLKAELTTHWRRLLPRRSSAPAPVPAGAPAP